MKIKTIPPRKSRAAKKKPEYRETAVGPSFTTRFLPWAMVLLVILFAALVRIRLLEIPLERDEGEYAYSGQLLLQGIPPYQAAFNMKFPGIYAAYAVIMAVFGQTVAGIHLGLLVLNAGTIVLVFLLGRRLFTPAGGVAAAAAYALLSVGGGILGTQAHATHFVVAAALGATLLLLRALDAETHATGTATGNLVTLCLSGALYGVAILMKQHGALFGIFGGLYLISDHWTHHRGGWLAMLRKLAVFSLGVVIPLGLTAFALLRAGVFDRFWFWTVSYAREYVLELPLSTGLTIFGWTFPQVVGPNLLLWLLAAAGLFILWWRKQDRASAVFASGFLVFSFLAICPGLYFRPHYFVLLLPAIALLVGAAVASTPKVAWLGFGAVFAISIMWQSNFLFDVTPLKACIEMYGTHEPFTEAREVGDYLRAHTNKTGRIAVLGSEPEIYFYANRRSATGYIYTYGMMEHQPFAVKMQNEMMHDVETVRPEYVVWVNVPSSWLLRDLHNQVLDWWNVYAAKNYDIVGVIDMYADRVESHWDVTSYRPHSHSYIAVCRRKS